MDSPVSPTVANLYMDEVESRALITFTGPAPSYFQVCGRHLGQNQSKGSEAITEQRNVVDSNINDTHPPAMLSCVRSPDSLTTIHTWTHLALRTHMNAGWINNSPKPL